MSDSTHLEDKITELLYAVRELQRDSENLKLIRNTLKVNSENTAQPLHKYGWIYCDTYTIHSNVYDCIKHLCGKIAALETTVSNLKKECNYE